MDGEIGKNYLTKYIHDTDTLFDTLLEEKVHSSARISKIPEEVMKRFQRTASKGKKIRGALMVLGHQIAGGRIDEKILKASLTVELFHAAILVHDDIMDKDDIRRGIPSIHKQIELIADSLELSIDPHHYGISVAMAVADAGFYISWDNLLNAEFAPQDILQAGTIYSRYVTDVAHGQILDMTTMGLHTIREEDVLKVLQYKTAEYTGVMPILMGAALGGLHEGEKIEALINYGRAFGWAFQIQDDVLGMYGVEKETGKSNTSDLKEGKNTLLMLHLAKYGNDEQKHFQRQVLGNPHLTQQDAETMRNLLKEVGSYQYVVDLGWDYVKKAQDTIPHITSDPELANLLSSLVIYMMERAK